MNPPSLQPLKPSGSRSASSLWRIRFVTGEVSVNARVVARFTDPSPATAAAELISQQDLTPGTDSSDQLDVMVTPDARDESAALLAAGAESAMIPLSLKFPAGRITWNPGRAVIEGDAAWCDMALPVLAEFAFYEGQLRKLEGALPACESAAPVDVALAYRPADRHQDQWNRLGMTMEKLAQLRLTYARLEPRLLYRSLTHKPDQRRIFSRLCRAADTEDRLEAVTNRLEACEDLYEGAIDRINDHRWYRKGHRLELAIVVLLVIEVLQIAIELGMRIYAGK
jgi:hypothetical protein